MFSGWPSDSLLSPSLPSKSRAILARQDAGLGLLCVTSVFVAGRCGHDILFLMMYGWSPSSEDGVHSELLLFLLLVLFSFCFSSSSSFSSFFFFSCFFFLFERLSFLGQALEDPGSERQVQGTAPFHWTLSPEMPLKKRRTATIEQSDLPSRGRKNRRKDRTYYLVELRRRCQDRRAKVQMVHARGFLIGVFGVRGQWGSMLCPQKRIWKYIGTSLIHAPRWPFEKMLLVSSNIRSED